MVCVFCFVLGRGAGQLRRLLVLRAGGLLGRVRHGAGLTDPPPPSPAPAPAPAPLATCCWSRWHHHVARRIHTGQYIMNDSYDQLAAEYKARMAEFAGHPSQADDEAPAEDE